GDRLVVGPALAQSTGGLGSAFSRRLGGGRHAPLPGRAQQLWRASLLALQRTLVLWRSGLYCRSLALVNSGRRLFSGRPAGNLSFSRPGGDYDAGFDHFLPFVTAAGAGELVCRPRLAGGVAAVCCPGSARARGGR